MKKDPEQARNKGRFEQDQANLSLRTLVESLPNLTSLDISGTNLAGSGMYADVNGSVVKCDIPGLV